MEKTRPTVLVTGAAGFIGFHLASKLAASYNVIGLDNFNDYYDPRLKTARAAILRDQHGIQVNHIDISNLADLSSLFDADKPQYVVHLAAQAGVRYSLDNPHAYVSANLEGFVNILESCRHNGVEHLLYASSSSVYGSNKTLPFRTTDSVDHPISLYAATKKANELMAHTYSHLFGLPTTGLRFFTVYGPWGRPDMALFKFTKAILSDQPIDVYNFGQMQRDFTYVDDVTESVSRLIPLAPSEAMPPYRVLNVGNNAPVALLDFVRAIEARLNRKANINLLPLQPGDVPATYADVDDLIKLTDFQPNTPISQGVDQFISWYLEHYASPEPAS